MKGCFEEITNYFFLMWANIEETKTDAIREYRIANYPEAIFRFELYDDYIKFIIYPYEREGGWVMLFEFNKRWSVEHMNRAINGATKGISLIAAIKEAV